MLGLWPPHVAKSVTEQAQSVEAFPFPKVVCVLADLTVPILVGSAALMGTLLFTATSLSHLQISNEVCAKLNRLMCRISFSPGPLSHWATLSAIPFNPGLDFLQQN